MFNNNQACIHGSLCSNNQWMSLVKSECYNGGSLAEVFNFSSIKQAMSTEITANQNDHVVTPDIRVFTRGTSAPRRTPPPPLSRRTAMLGLTEAVKALAQDVSEKMNQSGKRLEALKI